MGFPAGLNDCHAMSPSLAHPVPSVHARRTSPLWFSTTTGCLGLSTPWPATGGSGRRVFGSKRVQYTCPSVSHAASTESAASLLKEVLLIGHALTFQG